MGDCLKPVMSDVQSNGQVNELLSFPQTSLESSPNKEDVGTAVQEELIQLRKALEESEKHAADLEEQLVASSHMLHKLTHEIESYKQKLDDADKCMRDMCARIVSAEDSERIVMLEDQLQNERKISACLRVMLEERDMELATLRDTNGRKAETRGRQGSSASTESHRDQVTVLSTALSTALRNAREDACRLRMELNLSSPEPQSIAPITYKNVPPIESVDQDAAVIFRRKLIGKIDRSRESIRDILTNPSKDLRSDLAALRHDLINTARRELEGSASALMQNGTSIGSLIAEMDHALLDVIGQEVNQLFNESDRLLSVLSKALDTWFAYSKTCICTCASEDALNDVATVIQKKLVDYLNTLQHLSIEENMVFTNVSDDAKNNVMRKANDEWMKRRDTLTTTWRQRTDPLKDTYVDSATSAVNIIDLAEQIKLSLDRFVPQIREILTNVTGSLTADVISLRSELFLFGKEEVLSHFGPNAIRIDGVLSTLENEATELIQREVERLFESEDIMVGMLQRIMAEKLDVQSYTSKRDVDNAYETVKEALENYLRSFCALSSKDYCPLRAVTSAKIESILQKARLQWEEIYHSTAAKFKQLRAVTCGYSTRWGVQSCQSPKIASPIRGSPVRMSLRSRSGPNLSLYSDESLTGVLLSKSPQRVYANAILNQKGVYSTAQLWLIPDHSGPSEMTTTQSLLASSRTVVEAWHSPGAVRQKDPLSEVYN